MRGGWRCVFLHLTLTHEHTHTHTLGLKCIPAFCGHKCHEARMRLLPSDMSSSSRRLIPISWEGAFRLSVGVGNSGKEGGDCGDVSNPVRSSSAVPPSGTDRSRPAHHKQPFHTRAGTVLLHRLAYTPDCFGLLPLPLTISPFTCCLYRLMT